MNNKGANGECVKTEFHESDYITHHNDFVNACIIARDQALSAWGDNHPDVSYWQKQIDTLRQLKKDYHK